MRPAARLQAAIEILGEVLDRGAAADRAVQAWGRANRFAGSGDRRAIAEHVYAALRAAQSRDPRLAAIEGLKAGGVEPAAIAASFDGGRHAPAPLNDAERGVLAGPPAPPPLWLRQRLERAFGTGMARELEALKGRAPLDLRVNTLKSTRDAAAERLAADGVITAPLGIAPAALRVTSGEGALERSEAFASGSVEIQDAGSQAVAAMCAARPGMAALDLCAGAGGKTLALAAAMENSGRLVAADTGAVRLKRIAGRAARAGAGIIETTLLAADWLEAGDDPFGGARFDLVLVDAPCSGSGVWRRNPETRLRLTEDGVASLAALQARLLAAAAARVKPGGRLVYVTCSVLPDENEDVAQGFLEAASAFVAEGGPRRFSPAATDTDGFFAAIFRKGA